MTSNWRTAIVLGTLAQASVLFLAFLSVNAQPGDEPDPAIRKIALDWKRRLNGSKTIKYRVSGTTVNTKEFLAQEHKKGAKWEPKDVTLKRSFTMILDFQGKRQRTEDDKESFNASVDAIHRHVLTTVFDAQSYRGSGKQFVNDVEQKRPDTTDIGVRTKNFHEARFDRHLTPLFAGHGIVIIPPREDITVENMNQETTIDDIVYVHGQGVYEGRTCVILRTQPRKGDSLSFVEYWVDPTRESALVRQIEGNEKYPVFERNISYAKTAVGWLVDSWTMVHRTQGSGNILTASRSRFKVDERVIDYVADPDEFTMLVKPGMLVRKYSDQTEANHTFFRVDDSGREHQVRFDGGKERMVLGFLDYAMYSMLVLLILVAPLAVWKLRGWFIKHKSAPSV